VTLKVRSKLFLATFAVGALSALAVGLLLSMWLQRLAVERIEQTLGAETRLAAEMLTRNPGLPAGSLDEETDRIGSLLGVRVTFIAPDGKVLGDSTKSGADLAAMENHGHRPEILAAGRSHGEVFVRRYSTTTEYDTLYAAIPVSHPVVGFVRLALPLTEIAEQQRTVIWLSLGGVAASLPIAGLLAWALSAPMARRVSSIAGVARRYATGDLTRPTLGYGEDELGEVARALDGAVQELGRRMSELAHDRRHLSAILSGMVEGVIVLDARGRLVMANDAARDMLKLGDNATGQRYQEWMRQPELFALLAGVLEGEQPVGVEFSLARDPSRICIARAAPGGEPEGGAILVLHDISDLRRADRVRRDFVANVSHELRTPLTAIRGYVEALLEDPPSPEDSRRFLEVIARHTDRMERLVKDLLRLARLDAGQETPELVECDLHTVLQGVVHELAGPLAARQSNVTVHVPAEVRIVVSDPAKLHDVLRNLLENAVTYSPEQATVSVEASREQGVVFIRVLDEGPGIPPADLVRVFERFYRVDKSRSRAPGGTGIGLAIVKHLVELLGGTVVAANRPEGGAEFTVRLPQRAPQAVRSILESSQ
jgi:two-component system, OmpR family, phosphate regulon sensor histidine kinase PhoR